MRQQRVVKYMRGSAGRVASVAAGRVAAYAGKRAMGYLKGYASRRLKEGARGMLNKWRNRAATVKRTRNSGKIMPKLRKGARGGSSKASVGRSVPDKFTKFNRKGVAYYEENQGVISDLKAVYITAGSVAHDTVLIYTIAAIIKNLLEKAGIRVPGWEDTLSFSGFESGGSAATGLSTYVVQLISYSESSGAHTVSASIETSSASSLEGISISFLNYFVDWSSGYDNVSGAGNALNSTRPYCFLLRQVILNATASYGITLSEIQLGDVFIEVKTDVEMRAQNRSLADDGSANAEEISSQPVEGMLYYFSGVPRPRQREGVVTTGSRFSLLPTQYGVRSVAANTDAMVDMFHVPAKGYFSNCTSSKRVLLNPGTVHRYVLNKSKKMGLEQFMKILRIQYTTSGSGYLSNYSVFPCMMLGVEDVIGIDNADSVSVAFDVKRTVGIIATVVKKKWFKTSLNQYTIAAT